MTDMKTVLFAAIVSLLGYQFSCAAEPIRLIYDTDIGNDVDDVLALGVIHALQSRGHCRLLAVTVTKDNPKAAAFVDAVNTFYGYPNVPIGAVRNGSTPQEGRFLKLVDATDDEGRPIYPRDLASGNDAPDAVALLRRTLAAQPDQSVVLTQVGFFTNYKRLLESPVDDASNLTGKQLIQKKVRLLSIMAGSFQTINDNNRYLEYNVKINIPSAQGLARNWPTPIVWSGFEIGIRAAYPATSIERDYNYVAHHPLKEAYYLYNPPPHNRPTWDLTSVLYAVWPNRDYFALSAPGQVDVEDDGFTRFTPKPEGRDRFLILDPLRTARLREALVQLSAQPPAK